MRGRLDRIPKWLPICIVLCLPVASTPATSDAPRWIGTWSASPQPVWDTDFFASIKYPRTLAYQTIRQVARISIGGKRIRVVLSNEYGTRPVYEATDDAYANSHEQWASSSGSNTNDCQSGTQHCGDSWRVADAAGVECPWPDLMRDLDQVKAVQVTLEEVRYRLRTELRGHAAAAFAPQASSHRAASSACPTWTVRRSSTAWHKSSA